MTDEQENGQAPHPESGGQRTAPMGKPVGISKLSSGDIVGRFSEGLARSPINP